MNIKWILKPFNRLTAEELYQVLRLRNEVFVVEQNCVYQDADNNDQKAFHLLGMQGKKLWAYARLFAPGDYYAEAAIGRIVTAPEVRGRGVGKALVGEAIEIARRMYGEVPIAMGAQCYLEKFYNSFGFQKAGDTYLEDGIPHVKMILPVNLKEEK
jgi:ElaA protein